MKEELSSGNESYMQEKMDYKRLLLCFAGKWWVILLTVAAGALIGGISYLAVRAVNMPVQYEAVSKVYVRFIWDPSGQVEQHYNGYTWNDLMVTDPILDRTMESLEGSGIDRQTVIDATSATILSDRRLLTLTFVTDHEETTARIQKATQEGLVAYGTKNDEMTHIEVIRTIPAQLKVWDNRIFSAVMLGAVAFLIIAVFILLIYFVLDDSFYVMMDIKKRYSYPALGMLAKMDAAGMEKQPYGGEISANLAYLLKDKKRVVILYPGSDKPISEIDSWLQNTASGTAEISALKFAGIGWQEDTMTIFERIRQADGVLLALPFGQRLGKQTERVVQLLEQQDCRIAGMFLIEGDTKFWRYYYGNKKKA